MTLRKEKNDTPDNHDNQQHRNTERHPGFYRLGNESAFAPESKGALFPWEFLVFGQDKHVIGWLPEGKDARK